MGRSILYTPGNAGMQRYFQARRAVVAERHLASAESFEAQARLHETEAARLACRAEAALLDRPRPTRAVFRRGSRRLSDLARAGSRRGRRAAFRRPRRPREVPRRRPRPASSRRAAAGCCSGGNGVQLLG
jgi:hypothetical protein